MILFENISDRASKNGPRGTRAITGSPSQKKKKFQIQTKSTVDPGLTSNGISSSGQVLICF